MANNFNKPHIGKIENFASNEHYKYPSDVKISFAVREQNRKVHGNRILRQLQAIRQQFEISEEVEFPENIIRDDVIYVTFTSEWGYQLKFEQLHQNNERPTYQIVNIKQEKLPGKDEKYRYHVVVMLTKGGVSHFIKKVEDYLTENTKGRNAPQSNTLIANIESLKLAT